MWGAFIQVGTSIPESRVGCNHFKGLHINCFNTPVMYLLFINLDENFGCKKAVPLWLLGCLIKFYGGQQ